MWAGLVSSEIFWPCRWLSSHCVLTSLRLLCASKFPLITGGESDWINPMASFNLITYLKDPNTVTFWGSGGLELKYMNFEVIQFSPKYIHIHLHTEGEISIFI